MRIAHNRRWIVALLSAAALALLLPFQPVLLAQLQPLPQPEVNYSGRLLKIDGRSILLRLNDGRAFKVERSNKSKFIQNGKEIKASALGPGDQVSLYATQDQLGFLIAVRVELAKSATAEERAVAAGESEIRPQPLPPAERNARPTIRRKSLESGEEAAPDGGEGSPTRGSESNRNDQVSSPKEAPPRANLPVLRRRPETPEVQEQEPAASPIAELPMPPAPPPPPAPAKNTAPSLRFDSVRFDPEIEKARDASVEFSRNLPNFICQEFMSRFARATNFMTWQPLDVIAAELIYEDGKETYRNLRMNDRPTEKKLEEMGGAWSTGEFASTLIQIFQPESHTHFGPGKDAEIKGHKARVYDFDVKQENSSWHIQSDEKSVLAAYRGTLWVDSETARVLSIEMQAVDLPPSFPTDVAESTVDYAWVQIGAESALLPVRAESLGCQRGSNMCSRNVIDFRNYKKYTADAVIKFD